MDASQGRPKFSDVLAVRPFRSLWYAQLCSVTGDRLAVVALTVLVFGRSHSALLAAVAYAAGFVPQLAGALVLSGLADRYPGRRVMIGCDLARAVLVAVMTVPRLPLAALVVLLAATTALAPPFESARAVWMRTVLTGDRYVLGTAITQTTFRAGLVTGSAAGGVAVGILGTRPALGVDAATFLVSAALVRALPATRPAAVLAVRAPVTAALMRLRQGARTVFRNPVLRTLMLLGCLAAFYAVPDGLAAPLAHRFGAGPAGTGLVLAASPLGGVLVTPVFSRLVGPDRRLAWMGPLAVGACAVLCAIAVPVGGLGLLVAILAISGGLSAYQVSANAAFVTAVPDDQRAQAFGLANSGLIAGQGVMFVAAGAAAQAVGAVAVAVAAGGAGAAIAVLLWSQWRKISPQYPGSTNQPGGASAA